MKKLALSFIALIALAGAQAFAQPITNPAPVGAAGAYNSSPPTCTNGQFCFLQTDVSGNLQIDVAAIAGVTASSLCVTNAGVTCTTNVAGVQGVTGGIPVTTIASSQYPSGAIPITASATGTTLATVATLAAHATRTTYICGFRIGADATGFIAGTATVTGTITATMSFRQGVGAVATGTAQLAQEFMPCVPGSAANTAIAVTSVAAGVGGNTTVAAWGYQL